MPVTKKKGAIFAIYADSPERSSSKSSLATATSTTSSKSSLVSRSGSSPTKRAGPSKSSSTAPRRALASLQPSTVKAVRGVEGRKGSSDPVHDDEKKPASKASLNEASVNPKRNVTRSSTSTTTSSRRPPTASAPTRRQLQVFTSPSQADKPAASPRALGTVRTPRSPAPGASPTKKARATPQKSKKAFSIYTSPERPQKENVPPADSPASRTRSKTRAAAAAGLHVAVGDEENIYPSSAGDLTGDGRGTLTFKKGRALGEMMAKSTAEVPKKSVLSEKSTKSTKSTKAFTVRADDILADVSEAYGASGEEPEGFRTAGTKNA